MFNPVIIIAIIIQVLISKASRIGGAIFGYLITTGVLIWGISVYSERGRIAFFGIPLSETVFLIACLIWYAFDTRELIAAQKLTKKKQEFECSKCGTSVQAEDKFCPRCGANLEETITQEENKIESTTLPEGSEINEKLEFECSECGSSVRAEDKFCPKCGANLEKTLSEEENRVEKPKSTTTNNTGEKLEYECSECGSSVKAEDKFCTRCGANLEETTT